MKYPKSLFTFILFLATGCSLFDKEEESPTNISSLTISPDSLVLIEGQSQKLQLSFTLIDSSIQLEEKIDWYSQNDKVARVEGGVVTGWGHGTTYIFAESKLASDSIPVYVADIKHHGLVQLQNQTDHGAVMVNWLPLEEKKSYGGKRDGYVLTDSIGYFTLPTLPNGEWLISAEYPYYAPEFDTVTVKNGILNKAIKSFNLIQQLAFEVVLDITIYSPEDTIHVKFKAKNLTDKYLEIVSRGMPIYSEAYAFTQNKIPVMMDLPWYGETSYQISSHGAPAFDGRSFEPYEEKFEISDSDKWGKSFDMYIDLNIIEQYGVLAEGVYEVFAGYVADWSFPNDYFFERSKDFKTLNNSLYKKMIPQKITIKNN